MKELAQRLAYVREVVTVAELLEGKGVDYPRTQANATFKKAPRHKGKGAEQGALGFDCGRWGLDGG